MAQFEESEMNHNDEDDFDEDDFEAKIRGAGLDPDVNIGRSTASSEPRRAPKPDALTEALVSITRAQEGK